MLTTTICTLPLSVAYEEYVEEQKRLGCRVLSQAAVYRCLKRDFRVRQKVPFKECLCDTCVNNRLLIDALIVAGVKGLSRSLTDNITLSYCGVAQNKDPGAHRKLVLDGSKKVHTLITDHNRDCIYRNCQKCGAVAFQEALLGATANDHIEWSKIVVWHQWELFEVSANDDKVDESKKKVKCRTRKQEKQRSKQWDKFRYSGQLSQLLSLFTVLLSKLSVHMFNFRWQAFQFDECKRLLNVGDILFIIDFAQNHTHRRQDEIQSGFYSRHQTTMHPFIIYFVCEKCKQLIKDEVMIFSDHMTHDWTAANSFFQKVFVHLEEKEVPLKRMIIFSDNAGSQYKNCKVFDTLSRRNVPVIHNYFGAKHGKAEADGAIGRLSQVIESVVRSGQYELANSQELTNYCVQFLTHDVDTDTCKSHSAGGRHFYLVNDIKCEDNKDLVTVDGTRSFHSVRNTGTPGIVEVREASCFCEVCFLNHSGECKNKRLVKNFRWACTSKSVKDKQKIVHNVHWHSTSMKFQHKKDKVVKKIARTYIKTSVRKAKKTLLKKMINSGDNEKETEKHAVTKNSSKQRESRKTLHTRANSKRKILAKKKVIVVRDEDRNEPVVKHGTGEVVVNDSESLDVSRADAVKDIDKETEKYNAKTPFVDKFSAQASFDTNDGSDSDDSKPLSHWRALHNNDGNDSNDNKPSIHFRALPNNDGSESDDSEPLIHLRQRENDSNDDKSSSELEDSDQLVDNDSEDFESNMFLDELREYGNLSERETGPVLRTRLGLRKIYSLNPQAYLYLDDYEDPKEKGLMEESCKKAGCESAGKLLISGIDSLQPSEILDSSKTSRKSVDILPMANSSIVTNICGNRFSTPKRNDVPNISQMSVDELSPIPHGTTSLSKLSSDVQIVKTPVQKKTKNIYLKDLWMQFQNALVTCLTFEQLKRTIGQWKSKLTLLPPAFGDYSVALDRIDEVAEHFLPSDTPRKFGSKHCVPIKVGADGNCFFRSLSRLVYGDEEYHLEMRCRIIMDCVENIDKYTSHDYLMRGANHAHKEGANIASIYCDYSGVNNVVEKGIRDVFMEDILRIRKNKAYCDIWHFHSAANVLNSKIVAIFPDENNVRYNLRVDFNRPFLPSTPNFKNQFCLMWTAVTYPRPGTSLKNVKYNHIVPIVKRYITSTDLFFFDVYYQIDNFTLIFICIIVSVDTF